MHKGSCENKVTLDLFLTSCDFIGAFRRGQRQFNCTGPNVGWERRNKHVSSQFFLENTSNYIILRAGLEWTQWNCIGVVYGPILTCLYGSHWVFTPAFLVCSLCLCWQTNLAGQVQPTGTHCLLCGDCIDKNPQKLPMWTIWWISRGQRLTLKSSLCRLVHKGVVRRKTFMNRPCHLTSCQLFLPLKYLQEQTSQRGSSPEDIASSLIILSRTNNE